MAVLFPPLAYERKEDDPLRLVHIALKRIRVEDVSTKIGDVTMWRPYGWYAHRVLKDVSENEINEIECLTRTTLDV